MGENPWLTIPLADYHGHMEVVGQTAVLRRLFSAAYASIQPRRLAILGCTAGTDFDAVDASITDVAVGVDINASYLDAAAARLAVRGRPADLVRGDVLAVDLPQAPFDMVHAALLLEYVDAAALFRRVRQWLSPSGWFSVVTQEPLCGVPAVSSTEYASLQTLSGATLLRSADEVASIGRQEGFDREWKRTFELPLGKLLTHSMFRRSPKTTHMAPGLR